uniref:Uncharacterized protein n=1 Tax=Anguilla anguilla TaxID=7936 RepID=A0A0E9WGC8_ANGAN
MRYYCHTLSEGIGEEYFESELVSLPIYAHYDYSCTNFASNLRPVSVFTSTLC